MVIFYLYLSGISEMLKMRDLNNQSDVYLINEVRNGSGDAFGILAERYNYIISYNIAKLYSSFKFAALHNAARLEREDLFQECRIVLYKAAKYYDFMKNVKFSTYANICIKNYLASMCRKYKKTGKYAGYDLVPLDETLENEPGICDRYFAFTDENSFPEPICGALTVYEKKVLTMYIENRSYKYMAEILNKSVKSIDNAVCRIKSKLRPYAEYFVSEY